MKTLDANLFVLFDVNDAICRHCQWYCGPSNHIACDVTRNRTYEQGSSSYRVVIQPFFGEGMGKSSNK